MKKRIFIFGISIAAIMVMPISSAYYYSGTLIADYDNLDDLSMYSLQQHYDIVEDYLGNEPGWSENFLKTDDDVTESTFKSSVDNSHFHYHLGHGVHDWVSDEITEIALTDWWWIWTNWGDVRPQDIEGRWDYRLKWIFLHSCHLLEDAPWPYDVDRNRDAWAGGLDKCHMILGFATTSYTSTTLLNEFFDNAVDSNQPVTTSYYYATKIAFGSGVQACILADTQSQWNNDHLYGQGSVMADENPDDNSYVWGKWSC